MMLKRFSALLCAILLTGFSALLIDGSDCGIRLSGYADGREGIFCGVLTDAEADAIKNGANFALSPVQ